MRNSLLGLAAALLAFGLLFQNCGKGLKAASTTSESVQMGQTGQGTGDNFPVVIGGGTSSSDSPATQTVFNKGDTFDYNAVSNKSQMVQVQLDAFNYASYAGAKAVAINVQGLGFVSYKAIGAQSDANMTALEGCFALGGGQPCALLAVGAKFDVSSGDLANSYIHSLAAPSQITGATIPFLLPGLRSSVAQMYNGLRSPKALVVSVDGAYAMAADSDGAPIGSVAEARRLALERCELNAAITPCTVFAENSTVVLSPGAINRTPVIDYARTTVSTNIPGLRDSVFAGFMNNYIALVDGTSVHGAVYLAADGTAGMSYNTYANLADTNARAICAANVGQGYSCFRYALEKNIDSVAAQLFAVKNLPNLHCKMVPRASCAAHKAMGCGAGRYYVMDGTTPKLQGCN